LGTADVIEKATGAKLGEIGVASAEDVSAAVAAARKAQKEWAKLPAPNRGDVLREASCLMLAHSEEIADQLVRETGSIRAKAQWEIEMTAREFQEAAALASQPQGILTATLEAARQNIARRILSLTAPSVVRWEKRERREMARRVNEYTAELVERRPDRFGNFATLPVPDIDGALRELEHALDTLRADGVILLTNYAGKYLGDAAFEPLWAELDRHRAVVFVHPGQPPLPTAAGVAGPLVDYPFDTTRTAVQLVLNGIVDRVSGSSHHPRACRRLPALRLASFRRTRARLPA
jgi:hypothetical protein